MRLPLGTRGSMGLILALVALVAAAATITAAESRAGRLEAAACAGVMIPTAPPGSSIVLITKGGTEQTALAESMDPALERAGIALRHALGQPNNAEPVMRALSEAAKQCRSLGLKIQPSS